MKEPHHHAKAGYGMILVSESSFLATFSIISCFWEIGSVDTFSINVNCIIRPLSTICEILNSFVSDNKLIDYPCDLSLT